MTQMHRFGCVPKTKPLLSKHEIHANDTFRQICVSIHHVDAIAVVCAVHVKMLRIIIATVQYLNGTRGYRMCSVLRLLEQDSWFYLKFLLPFTLRVDANITLPRVLYQVLPGLHATLLQNCFWLLML